MTELRETPSVAVPFLDLGPSHANVRDAVVADIASLFDSNAFTNGPPVAAFEEAFAVYAQAAHCVGTGSGLDALRLGLLAAGLEPGDEVIVPAQTFVATLEAVTQAGGRAVLADVDAATVTLDPQAAADAWTPKTRFIMPVHLYGQLADMRSLARLASERNALIIEDACQAHGASRDGFVSGECSTAAAFSFYPGKNLGAIGDAGALVTGDDGIAERVRGLREHGQVAKYQHAVEGWTSRLDTVQAIALLHKLPLLDLWNEQRRAAATRYDELLADVGDLVLPTVAAGSNPVWHLYVIQTSDPAALGDFLRGRGIGTGRHYPQPPHLAPAYAHLGYSKGRFPAAEAAARRCLSLPIFPGITDAQIDAVAAGIRGFFGG